ncbi:MAG: hypothetical protein AAGG69_00325 [Pseudomonadota bacterium]
MTNSIYLMVLLGCGHDFAQCHSVSDYNRTYETRAVCEQRVDRKIRQDFGSPMTFGQCIKIPRDHADQKFKIVFSKTEGAAIAPIDVNQFQAGEREPVVAATGSAASG